MVSCIESVGDMMGMKRIPVKTSFRDALDNIMIVITFSIVILLFCFKPAIEKTLNNFIVGG